MQIDRNEVFSFIEVFFSEKGFVVSQDTKLIEDGILDSMELVDFIMYLEESLSLEFCPTSFEVQNFKSINLLISSLVVI